MKRLLSKWWYSLNYRFCKSEQYLAYQRGERVVAAEWQSRASEWEREYLMVGRSLT